MLVNDCDRFMTSLDPHSKLVVKYVVSTLLEVDSFSTLQPFIKIFHDLEKAVPGFLPDMAKAVMELGQCDFNIGEIHSVVNLHQQTKFFNSKLYGGFMKARCAHQVGQLRAAAEKPSVERLAAARRLLQSEHIAPEHKSELEQVVPLLGGASDEVKLAWLLQDIDRFDMLSAWCPKSDLGNAYYFAQSLAIV